MLRKVKINQLFLTGTHVHVKVLSCIITINITIYNVNCNVDGGQNKSTLFLLVKALSCNVEGGQNESSVFDWYVNKFNIPLYMHNDFEKSHQHRHALIYQSKQVIDSL